MQPFILYQHHFFKKPDVISCCSNGKQNLIGECYVTRSSCFLHTRGWTSRIL